MYMILRPLPIQEHLGEVLRAYDWLDNEGVGPGMRDPIRVVLMVKDDQELLPPKTLRDGGLRMWTSRCAALRRHLSRMLPPHRIS
jgi:hypothetical protein